MNTLSLQHDPFNLIITGVGGQGNVLGSRLVGNMLSRKGFSITIGETFGASQRGGAVMSHMRISTHGNFSPQIPKGRAHMIVALEPVEAIRVLVDYGNPGVRAIVNTRPLHPAGVIAGNVSYPSIDELQKWTCELSAHAWFMDATFEAMKLGNPIFANIIMAGALAGTGTLPLQRKDFQTIINEQFSSEKADVNLKAFDIGYKRVEQEMG
ncbi:MAG: indolepyruvate oxidoreductase subunit beta [Proteobacteria bacterium]|nr:indolepyruvate oxidoreductase subunit beta [Pseudomonadota bacterium]